MKLQSKATSTRILGRPAPGAAPWAELPFVAYWVDRLPSSPSSVPQYMTVGYANDGTLLFAEVVEDLDVALSKAHAETQSEDAARAVAYRFALRQGTLDSNTPSSYTILIDGYYEMTFVGIANWVSALEIPYTASPDGQENIELTR